MAQPTMNQVAERAGVSTALVSLVMREAPNVSEYRRQLVLDAAEELGYRPNRLAANLASKRTSTIGVVLNDLHNPFFAETVDGMMGAADAAEYRILIGNGRRSRTGEAEAVETFLQYRVDGLILAGTRLSVGEMEAASRSTAVTIVGRTTRSSIIDSANNDEAIGAKLAVDHLARLGHRSIAHIAGGRGAGAAARRRGYEAAMFANGLEAEIDVVSGDFTEVSGYRGAVQLIRRELPPTAIFSANDLTAVGALDAVEDAGMLVPDDVSIVGYDNTSLAAMHHLSLTTVDQPREELGQRAVKLVLARLANPDAPAVHHVVAPTLVERASSGPVPTHPQ